MNFLEYFHDFFVAIRLFGFGSMSVSREDLVKFLKSKGIVEEFLFRHDHFLGVDNLLREVNAGKISFRSVIQNTQEKQDFSREVSLSEVLCLTHKTINICILNESRSMILLRPSLRGVYGYSLSDKMKKNEGPDQTISRIIKESIGLDRDSYEIEFIQGSYSTAEDYKYSEEYRGLRLISCESWDYNVVLKDSSFVESGYSGIINNLMIFHWNNVRSK